jgi:hypothetical protein
MDVQRHWEVIPNLRREHAQRILPPALNLAIADHLTSTKKQKATMEARIIVEGCRRSGIHWLSQMMTDDGSTWVADLQNGGEFNNDDAFSWVYKSCTANGTRTATTHKNKWSVWASKVKIIHCCDHYDSQTADRDRRARQRARNGGRTRMRCNVCSQDGRSLGGMLVGPTY